MKTIFYFSFSFCALFFCFSCNSILENENLQASSEKQNSLVEESVFNETQTFRIIKGPCGSISYKDRIGENYQVALDSLISIVTPLLNFELQKDRYYIDKDTIIVDFKVDNRIFIAHGFRRVSNNHYIFSISDVIDEKGNYYVVQWCED